MLSKIYGLKDSEDSQEIRYVGRTIQPLRVRLHQHIDFARRKKSTCARAQWIRTKLEKGTKPVIVQLEEVPLEESPDAEGRWIQYCRSLGYNLLNEQSHNVGGSKSYVVDWTPDKLGKLGKVSDTELAIEFGIDRKSVEYKRKTLGIARKPQTNFVVPPMGGWNRIEWPASVIERFGTLPDYVLARELGVQKSVVARGRKRLGIPSYAEQHNNPSQYKTGHKPTRWDKERG